VCEASVCEASVSECVRERVRQSLRLARRLFFVS
jgi:hypothetical protein